jgi:hypothetical protein
MTTLFCERAAGGVVPASKDGKLVPLADCLASRMMLLIRVSHDRAFGDLDHIR